MWKPGRELTWEWRHANKTKIIRKQCLQIRGTWDKEVSKWLETEESYRKMERVHSQGLNLRKRVWLKTLFADNTKFLFTLLSFNRLFLLCARTHTGPADPGNLWTRKQVKSLLNEGRRARTNNVITINLQQNSQAIHVQKKYLSCFQIFASTLLYLFLPLWCVLGTTL